MNYLSKLACGLFILAAFVLPSSAHAQLQEVEQTVFGMDCAPCAYALQKSLKSMDGVTGVDVSLNNGLAVLQFAPDNEVTLEEIRTAVRESGFSPETATITVSGTLAKEGGQWVLTSTSGARYVLEQSAGNVSDVDLSAQEQVTVTGTVPEGEKPSNGWRLEVKMLDHT